MCPTPATCPHTTVFFSDKVNHCEIKWWNWRSAY